MPFFLGQKVVYVGPDYRGSPITALYKVSVPTPYVVVYRIRSGELECRGARGYLLEGIDNEHLISPETDGQEMLIDTHLLRPVIDRKEQAFFTSGAPVDTNALDNRRRKRQKVWRIKLPSS
jgi:hypothetical protein